MIICFGHTKGGVGKSSLACAFAAQLANEGQSVVLVDTDEQESSALWYSYREERKVTPSVPVVSQRNHPERLVIDLADRYNVVLVDIGGNDANRMAPLMRICDLWIAPCKLAQHDVETHIRLMSTLQDKPEIHKSGNGVPVITILTGTPCSWNSKEPEEIRKYLNENAPNSNVLVNHLRERRSWRDQTRSGYGVTELPGKANEQARSEFMAVYNETFDHPSLAEIMSAGQ